MIQFMLHISVPVADYANTGHDYVFFTGPGLQLALFQHFKGMFTF